MADYNSAYTGAQIDANLAKAATAVQPAGLATVATTGAYNDLSGKPTLGTAAAAATGDFATAAQGTLADTATQPGDDAADLGSGAATDGYVLTADGAGGAAWEAAAGGGGTPGGSDTQVQFNDGGAFGGDSGFTFDKTNNTLGLGGGTITASDPIIDMAQTWNNGAVAFTALKANVTDTASAAGSLLMDLQVGGVSQFSVSKTGAIRVTEGSYPATTNLFGTSTNGIGTYSNIVTIVANNTQAAWVSGTSLSVLPTMSYSWANNGVAGADLTLFRDAANTLAQRNGVNAQAFNLYNTYTDASNYERGFMRFVSNVLQIGAEAAGTGTGRNISISPGGAGTQIVSVAMTGFQAFDLRYGGTPFINFQKYAGGGTTGWVTNASDIHYRWTPSGTALAEGDVGIKRDAAGVLKITNGNNAASGTGKLIFIVPTTDPGITGALWNNLGVLSISA